MLPGNRLLRSQSCLGNLFSRWMACVARQIELLDGKGVARAEEGADVPEGADVVGQ